MSVGAETGGWCRGLSRAAERSGTPESRPQLEELHSGERVTEPAAWGGRGDRPRPSRRDRREA
jgi:hypothetical protein